MNLGQNKRAWRVWVDDGEKWSSRWGSPQAQWDQFILPRIRSYLGGDTLEIAVGHGRWTQFLLQSCASFIGVDLEPSCVERCRERFPGARFEVCDGMALPVAADESIDFCFSFDSLVHCEADVLESYVLELARVLKPGGTAFFHHSNLADVTEPYAVDEHGGPGWRALSMGSSKMREFAASCGTTCTQECIPWGTEILSDCLSLITKP